MDSDRIKGTARAAAGSLEEQYGQFSGNRDAETAGFGRRVAGASQDFLGQAKDSLREQADRASGYAEEAYEKGRRSAEQGARVLNGTIGSNPVMAILVACALGYAIGIVAGRRRG